jgi:hypothetical protein
MKKIKSLKVKVKVTHSKSQVGPEPELFQAQIKLMLVNI